MPAMPKSRLLALVATSFLVSCSSQPTSAPQSPPEYETRPTAAPAATEAAAASGEAAPPPPSKPADDKAGADAEECTDFRCTVPEVTDAVKAKIEAFKDNPDFELRIDKPTADGLKSLSKVPWVKNLSLRGDKITDITPVAQLKGLKKFDAYGCGGITDAKALGGLTELTYVSLYMTKVADIAPLTKLTKLEELDLYATQVTDLSPLKSFKKLKKINLYMVKAKDWAPLAELTELESIWLQFSDIKDLRMLAKATKMKSLLLSWCENLTDISAVANMPDLETIELKDAPLKSLAPLSKLTKLTTVEISGTTITDLSPLKASVKSKTLRWLTVPKAAGKAAEGFKKDVPELSLTVADK